jgi:hypothetical protein
LPIEQPPKFIIAGQDPVELGLTPSLARPGGNVTGVVLGSVLVYTRYAIVSEQDLKEAVAKLSKLAARPAKKGMVLQFRAR